MSKADNQYYMAQRSVIGSLLLDAPHVAGMVMHRARPEDNTGECRTLFEACRELFQAGRPIDPTTVRAKVGGEYTQFLLQLMDETPTAANVEEYIKLTVEEAIKIKLSGEASSEYHVYYRVHAENFGWLGWAKNGEKSGTEGYAYRLEALQIKLVPKGTENPELPTPASAKKEAFIKK